MPIYEYICNECGCEFEELARSMSESGAVPCPACENKLAERKLSVFAARESDSFSFAMPQGGCGRCGDPNGPCSM